MALLPSCKTTRADANGYGRLISFEINFITKETSRAEPEYMNNTLPPISVLAPALKTTNHGCILP